MKAEKIEAVEFIKSKLKENSSIILADYRGLTVAQMAKLRKNLREAETEFRVIKNTLAKIAADNLDLKELSDMLSGPIALALTSDPIPAAKVLNSFAKEVKELEVKGALVDGKVLASSDVKRLAELPSREKLVAMLLGQLQSPMVGLVNVLNNPIRNLVYLLDAISKQKAA